jgi:putative peptidoglycan lipid II flippase
MVASQLGTAAFPRLARLWSGRASREFMSATMRAIRMGLFLTIPAAAGLIVLGGSVIRTVFQRAAFDEQAAQLTTLVVICYAIGLPFRGASAVLGKALYATRDGWWLVLLIGTGFMVATSAGSVLMLYLGAAGLALGLSVESATTSLLLTGFLSHRLGERLDAENGPFFAKAGCAAFTMVAVIVPAKRLSERVFGASHIESVLILGALITLGVLVYVGASNLIRVRETAVLQEFVFARFSRRKLGHG